MDTETDNMEETQISSDVDHDHDPNALTYMQRSSKHVPSLQIHAYGRLGAKHERTLPHTSNKGPVPKP
jgi:hypothetical protein